MHHRNQRNHRHHGTVYLVGAGPGDPELMTLKAMKLLQLANVVIYDRLIPLEVLTWCNERAILIDVGKYPDHHRMDQSQINQLLVDSAKQHPSVVRLKGGDPFVFGRGMEEMEFCRQAGIDCQVVPGVSSCLSAPAMMGIPVTSRGIARSFTVITGQSDPQLDYEFDFPALAATETIVVLMGRKNIKTICEGLIAAGREHTTPAAAIENATLPEQRSVCGDLASLPRIIDQHQMQSPVVVVIGAVAGFYAQPIQPADDSGYSLIKSISYDISKPSTMNHGA